MKPTEEKEVEMEDRESNKTSDDLVSQVSGNEEMVAEVNNLNERNLVLRLSDVQNMTTKKCREKNISKVVGWFLSKFTTVSKMFHLQKIASKVRYR